MMFILVIVALVFNVSAVQDEIRGRILNGKNARRDEFKYMAVIIPKQTQLFGLISKKYMCGGTIISPNWVLTAAHCLYDVSKAKVYLGVHITSDAEIVYKLQKTAFQIHPAFDFDKKTNDIALIQIPATRACGRINFAQLPFNTIDQHVLTGRIGVVMGWGQPDDNNSPTGRLQWTETAIMSNEECQIFHINTDKQFCGNTRRPYGSPCFGDSGGPLILKQTGEQIGIVSHFIGESCEVGRPAIFTRVSSYLPWICELTGMNS